MGENFYIFKSGRLQRKDNNVEIVSSEGEKKNLKIEMLEAIYLFGEMDLNTKVLNFLAQNKVLIHFFNYYGFYTGSFMPAEKNVSGYLLVHQVEHYTDLKKRMNLAKKVLHSGSKNILRNLNYYQRREIEIKEVVSKIERLIEQLDTCKGIQELMGVEGNIRKEYYSAWQDIFRDEVEFEKRVKRPPDNMVNSLISYINSLLYTTILAEIYKTQLNPTISFLHEPSTQRFSLALDISEIFKPLIVDRLIFSLINKKQITEKHFEEGSNCVYLTEVARKIVLQEYSNRLEQTIKHKDLKREVSYRYLIRLECYKLIKHLIGEKEYEGFHIWW
ncbi:type I-B CRISPR-associated endonuclease Cas1 [Clostridiales bacterium COT073_COT-073]|nr:type I-B CRISPR-associated endonuclease Cas1 [Clostridiales bacterium COT073_COT-073]